MEKKATPESVGEAHLIRQELEERYGIEAALKRALVGEIREEAVKWLLERKQARKKGCKGGGKKKKKKKHSKSKKGGKGEGSVEEKVVAVAAEEEKKVVVAVPEEEEEEAECAICRLELSEGMEEEVKLVCDHRYRHHCLTAWVVKCRTKDWLPSCPM